MVYVYTISRTLQDSSRKYPTVVVNSEVWDMRIISDLAAAYSGTDQNSILFELLDGKNPFSLLLELFVSGAADRIKARYARPEIRSVRVRCGSCQRLLDAHDLKDGQEVWCPCGARIKMKLKYQD